MEGDFLRTLCDFYHKPFLLIEFVLCYVEYYKQCCAKVVFIVDKLQEQAFVGQGSPSPKCFATFSS